ncbi:U3 small nucleolar ribonucleoprotein protein MPP10 [Latimeria chalumnae]|uniref:U3 small nucleolar ribonucleoprotein protein MPP10 n=1 Tax=Latimeria chalumnae TaxID=7897 RepID=H3BGK2_LATCH|nr:PREDICTED: U3 small nucleolar ribonucleoprotein protein MPP10 [Latimeria chalumnae]|eukprot:XP_005987807.1 PREDICTED: U3 small nucleolar ribonucleoprotein protein MPP10 [Latimeria chalumnae]
MSEGLACSTLQRCLKALSSNTAHPEHFLSVQDGLALEFTSLTKTLYDLQKSQEQVNAVGSPLTELVVENFDEEQIWQELELQNNSVLNHFKKVVAKTVRDNDIHLLPFNVEDEAEPEEEAASENADLSDEGIPEETEEDEIQIRKSKIKPKQTETFSDDDSDVDFDIDKLEKQSKGTQKKAVKHVGKSVVDDRFFKLAEMEAFLEDEERKEEKGRKDDDDSIDYFEDISSDDDDDEEEEGETERKKKRKIIKSSRDLKYKDYFDPVEYCGQDREDDNHDDELERSDKEEEEEEMEMDEEDEEEMEESEGSRTARESLKKVTFDLSDDSEGEDVGDILGGKKKIMGEMKSPFEKRQEKMNEKIMELEQEALEEKPWQLIGEVTGQKRPENSILEENLQFDHAIRMAPVITEETTLQLEDIIKQRIKDQSWDDVVRKEKPKEDTFEYKKRLTLDHEKSKLNLAEVYEQEYLKQTQQKTEEEENPQHVEIQKVMDSLFLKLDALSNFHFTPKPPVPEVKVISNLPSIAMEEVAPVNVSDATLLAPEEIKNKNKAGDVKADTEKTRTDKKRERRKKKLLKRTKLKEKEKRQKLLEKNTGQANKHSKQAAVENLKKLTKEGKATLLKDEGKDKALKSSQAFFSQLQDQVKVQIKVAKDSTKNKKKQREISVNKLKL